VSFTSWDETKAQHRATLTPEELVAHDAAVARERERALAEIEAHDAVPPVEVEVVWSLDEAVDPQTIEEEVSARLAREMTRDVEHEVAVTQLPDGSWKVLVVLILTAAIVGWTFRRRLNEGRMVADIITLPLAGRGQIVAETIRPGVAA
jgi:hypothetical protein